MKSLFHLLCCVLAYVFLQVIALGLLHLPVSGQEGKSFLTGFNKPTAYAQMLNMADKPNIADKDVANKNVANKDVANKDMASKDRTEKASRMEAEKDLEAGKNSSEKGASAKLSEHYVAHPRSREQKKQDEYLVKELKRVGADLKPHEMETKYPEWVDKPVSGFHPVKSLLQPVYRLAKNSTEFQKQILRLEGPIAGLQGPMLGLHKRMTSVETRMGSMQSQLGHMNGRVGGIAGQMTSVDRQMAGVRQDLGSVRKELNEIEIPIRQLRDPITGVATPLTEVRKELAEMKALLATVLFAIIIAAIAVAVGTPIAAVLIYFNRRKIFPKLKDHEFPVAKAGDMQGSQV